MLDEIGLGLQNRRTIQKGSFWFKNYEGPNCLKSLGQALERQLFDFDMWIRTIACKRLVFKKSWGSQGSPFGLDSMGRNRFELDFICGGRLGYARENSQGYVTQGWLEDASQSAAAHAMRRKP